MNRRIKWPFHGAFYLPYRLDLFYVWTFGFPPSSLPLTVLLDLQQSDCSILFAEVLLDILENPRCRGTIRDVEALVVLFATTLVDDATYSTIEVKDDGTRVAPLGKASAALRVRENGPLLNGFVLPVDFDPQNTLDLVADALHQPRRSTALSNVMWLVIIHRTRLESAAKVDVLACGLPERPGLARIDLPLLIIRQVSNT